MKILSFSHPHVVPNLYAFLSSAVLTKIKNIYVGISWWSKTKSTTLDETLAQNVTLKKQQQYG